MKPHRNLGMTRWELAVVLLIVAGLVVLIVLKYTKPPPPKVSRVRSDMRSLATAIETYYIDEGVYPLAVPWIMPENWPAYSSFKKTEVYPKGVGALGNIMTTPIAYISTHFPDPHNVVRGAPFAYYTDGVGWILFSPGPDGKFDITDPAAIYDGTVEQPSERLLLLSYDPTNGTESAGDVWRVKQ